MPGERALDVGASTGGFVDCLLQAGAAQVIALDVGRGQLDSRLRGDPRVVVMDGVNARLLRKGDLPYEPDLLTMDVSFISVGKVLGAVADCMAAAFEGVILIKPQFEAGPRRVGKKGIVRDPDVHRQVLTRCAQFCWQKCSVWTFWAYAGRACREWGAMWSSSCTLRAVEKRASDLIGWRSHRRLLSMAKWIRKGASRWVVK